MKTISAMSVYAGNRILVYVICYLPVYAYGLCSTDFGKDPESPYRKYQTTTAYDDSGRDDITLYDVPTGCKPLGMVFVARHGSRHRPTSDEAEKFAKLESLKQNLNVTGKAQMCSNDLQRIQLWDNWYHPDLKTNLTELGYREMIGLGKRFSQALPQLFTDRNRLKYYSSDYQRTRESTRMFMENTHNSSKSIIINDTIIFNRPICDRYLEEIFYDDNIVPEKTKFAQGEVFVEMASNIAKRLGVPESEIDIGTIDTLYLEGCAEKVAVDGKNSPWCHVFTTDDLKAIEYRDDMGDYMKHGYGIELSYKSGCLTKRFILDALKNISDGNVVSHFLNGHGWLLLRVLADMKLIEKEAPFKAEDYPERLNRKFKVSMYAPNGGNVAFLVNQCGVAKKLQVFHNERPVPLPLKNPVSHGMLDLKAALEYFGYNDPNDCNWDDMCSLDRVTTTRNSAINEATVQGIDSSRTESGPNKTLKDTILDILSVFRNAFMHYD